MTAMGESMGNGVYSRSFLPVQTGIADASRFVDETIEVLAGRDSWLLSVAPSLHVILDEICSNIVRHSGASGFNIDIEIEDSPPAVKMTFVDDGVAYNPLTHADPDTTLPAEDRLVGGLGILMVKKMASSISYRRDHDRNFLAVVLGRPGGEA